MTLVSFIISASLKCRVSIVRTIRAVGVLVLLFLTSPADLHAQFTFATNNGVITITEYTGAGGAVTIPSETNGFPVTTIGTNAFWGTPVTAVQISNGITEIAEAAFQTCFLLTNVVIPPSVVSVGLGAFAFCSFASVNVPSGTTNVGIAAFAYNSKLTEITVDAESAFYSSLNGVLFDKARTSLIEFPGGIGGSYGIPNGVMSIGRGAFAGCNQVLSITVPATVTEIGTSAFEDCYELLGLYFQGGPPSAHSCFGNCNATAYYLPEASDWGMEFDGHPAVLWNPEPSGGSAYTNRFGFAVTGTPNIPIVVAACTDLAHPIWVDLQTCALTNGLIFFSDPQWRNYPVRFYRIHSP